MQGIDVYSMFFFHIYTIFLILRINYFKFCLICISVSIKRLAQSIIQCITKNRIY
jgi:hypothetical protein